MSDQLSNVATLERTDEVSLRLAAERMRLRQDAGLVQLQHFKKPVERSFTAEERDKVTILFGNLHWRAERVMQGVFSNLGYRTQILPTATRADLLSGREVADIGQCCPTSFTTGNLVNTLRNEARRIGAQRYMRLGERRRNPARQRLGAPVTAVPPLSPAQAWFRATDALADG